MIVREDIARVLVYRLGSLGDTVVTLPCLHLAARAFPRAERRLLTGLPVSAKAPPVAQVLGDSGLVHGTMTYATGTRSPSALLGLRRQVRDWRPQVLVYLTETWDPAVARRNTVFFRLCGVGEILGAPLTRDLCEHRWLPGRGLWEFEAERLARCLAPLGDARLADPASWDLRFTAAERLAVGEALAGWPGADDFLAFSIGAKVPVKDWGDGNWTDVLAGLARLHPRLGLALIGARDESARSRGLAAGWPGPVLDLCGRLSPRESAVAIARARVFLGHDSGPMHLAAAVGTPAVAVFSARARPGIWFPYGADHRVLYHRTPCFDCRLELCTEHDMACLRAIPPDAVLAEAAAALAARPAAAARGGCA